ncbi:MAG: hypothetical protein ACK4PI_01335 [Tepidisphaerales bacterium]
MTCAAGFVRRVAVWRPTRQDKIRRPADGGAVSMNHYFLLLSLMGWGLAAVVLPAWWWAVRPPAKASKAKVRRSDTAVATPGGDVPGEV